MFKSVPAAPNIAVKRPKQRNTENEYLQMQMLGQTEGNESFPRNGHIVRLLRRIEMVDFGR